MTEVLGLNEVNSQFPDWIIYVAEIEEKFPKFTPFFLGKIVFKKNNTGLADLRIIFLFFISGDESALFWKK